MATEFEQEDVFTAEDFEGEGLLAVRPMSADEINKASIASLNSLNPVDSFVDISQERAMSNTSITLEGLQEESRAETRENLEAQLPAILSDENLTIDQKRNVVTGIQNDASPLFDQRNITANNLTAKGLQHEELNREEQSIQWAASLNEWNEIAQQEQQMLASFVASRDPEALEAMTFLADFSTGIAPFSEHLALSDLLGDLAKEGITSESESFLPKTQREELRSLSRRGSVEENKEMLTKIFSLLDKTGTPYGIQENTWLQVELARSLFDDTYSSDFTEYASNTAAVVDLAAAVLPPIKLAPKVLGALKGTKGGQSVERLMKSMLAKVRTSYVKGSKSTVSPAEMAVQTNPDVAKGFHEALEVGDADTAKAIYGTDRAGAVMDDIMPDPHMATGEVNNKVTGIDAVVEEIEAIKKSSGRTSITQDERLLARDTVVSKIEKGSTDEISFRDTQSQFGELDESGRFNYSAVYGATDTAGFSNVDDAVEQVLFAHRNAGAVEDDLTILTRSKAGGYTETTLEEARQLEDSEFLVKLKMQHEVTYKDVKNFGADDAKLVTSSLLDRLIPKAQGHISGYVKVMDSTFEKYLQTPIFAEAERTTRISDVFRTRVKDFTIRLKGLTDGQLTRVDEYLRRANLEEIRFSRKELKGKGWSIKEIDTVQSFRDTYDAMWKLDNRAEVASLRAKGFGKISLGDESEFLGKEIDRVAAGLDGTFYHPDLGEVLPLADLNRLGIEFSEHKLYQLPAKVKGGEASFEYVLTNERNWRGLRDFDEVKAYRDGYYTVDYVDPIFIKKVSTVDGVERSVAVATAGDTQAANREIARLTAQNTEEGATFQSFKNVKDKDAFTRQVDIEHGRYSMKFRGERLGSSNGASDETLRAPIRDPLSAMIQSSDKLAQRLGMDEVFTTLEARFIAAYKDLLPTGQFPSSVADIGTNISGQGNRVADAKVMFNWLEAQRRPDIAIADPAIQSALTSFAEELGEKAFKSKGTSSQIFGTGEKVLRNLAEKEPVTALKSAVFQVFVALNPPRQLSLAVVDTLKTVAIAPKYVASGRSVADSTAMLAVRTGNLKTAAKISGRTEQEIKLMSDEFLSSGLSSGIEQQKLIQAGIKTSAKEVSLKEATKAKPIKGAKDKLIDINERVGFQAAEKLQNVAAWLAFREAKVKEVGRFRLSKFELDEVTAEARHFAYSQTRAAAPTYNAALSTVMQFAGVIHKGISLTLPQALGGSKALTAAQKIKLNGFFLAAYGASLTQGLDDEIIKIENKQVRESLRSGLLWTAVYNLTGANISTKGLNPADYGGFVERVRQVASGEWAEASPALGIADKVKHNAEAFMGMFGEGNENVLDLSTGEKAINQLRALFEFYPAASKFWNAKMIEKVRRSSSKYNYTKADNVTLTEIIAKKFGFTLKEEEDQFVIRNASKAAFDKKQADVKGVINNLRTSAYLSGITNEELALRIATTASFWETYAGDRVATDMLNREVKKMMTQDKVAFKRFTQMLGIVEEEELLGLRNISSLSEEEREFITTIVEAMADAKAEIE